MNIPTIGIIGGGFVGGATADGFKHYTDVKVYDIDTERATNSYEETIRQDVLFVCLPTPMREDGGVDTTLLESELFKLNGMLEDQRCKPVLIRSTVPPDDLGRWILTFSDALYLIHNPEFLTERTAALDFQQTTRLIFGVLEGEPENPTQELLAVRTLFEARFPQVPQHWVSFIESSLIKYATNVFFATKISLFNELTQVAEAFGIYAPDFIARIMLDARIGRSHFMVPGHDGKRGFGGHCFPKDVNGFLKIAESVGVKPTVTRAVWCKNLEVRPEQDWEHDLGRAVSYERDEDEAN